MRSLLVALVVVGCAQQDYGTVPYQAIDRTSQTWSYCGAAEYHQIVRDAVTWWASQGPTFAGETECGAGDVEILDQTGDDRGMDYAETTPDRRQIRLYGLFYREPRVRTTTMRHELGHVFGFDHGGTRDCLMFPWNNESSGVLCADEARHLSK